MKCVNYLQTEDKSTVLTFEPRVKPSNVKAADPVLFFHYNNQNIVNFCIFGQTKQDISRHHLMLKDILMSIFHNIFVFI